MGTEGCLALGEAAGAYSSPPCNAEFKSENEWSCTSTLHSRFWHTVTNLLYFNAN